MKIIVFGPTGGAGRRLVDLALRASHSVTAFTRNAGAVEPREGLAVIEGDALQASHVDNAVAGRDAVVSALGGRPWRRAPICAPATVHIAGAMKKHGLRRIVVISTNGAGDSRARLGWFTRNALFGLALRNEVADKEAMESVLDATDLDWVAVRVGRLTNNDARGAWRAADDGSIREMGRISRSDVAAFMLAQLASDRWTRRKPILIA